VCFLLLVAERRASAKAPFHSSAMTSAITAITSASPFSLPFLTDFAEDCAERRAADLLDRDKDEDEAA
jgi:hypothetical protein